MTVTAAQTSEQKDLTKPKLTPRKLIPLGVGIAFFVIVGFVYIPFETFILVFVFVYLPFIFAFLDALRKAMEREAETKDT